MSKLAIPADLEWMGIDPPSVAKMTFLEEEERIMYTTDQDAIAECAAEIALFLAAHRVVREAAMIFGWSSRSLLFVSEKPGVPDEELARLEMHHELDMEASLHPWEPGVSELRDMSQFRLPVSSRSWKVAKRMNSSTCPKQCLNFSMRST